MSSQTCEDRLLVPQALRVDVKKEGCRRKANGGVLHLRFEVSIAISRASSVMFQECLICRFRHVPALAVADRQPLRSESHKRLCGISLTQWQAASIYGPSVQRPSNLHRSIAGQMALTRSGAPPMYCLALFVSLMATDMQSRAQVTEPSVSSDLHELRLLEESLQTVQHLSSEDWREVLTSLYSGRATKEEERGNDLAVLYRVLGTLAGTRDAVLGLCKKVPLLTYTLKLSILKHHSAV